MLGNLAQGNVQVLALRGFVRGGCSGVVAAKVSREQGLAKPGR